MSLLVSAEFSATTVAASFSCTCSPAVTNLKLLQRAFEIGLLVHNGTNTTGNTDKQSRSQLFAAIQLINFEAVSWIGVGFQDAYSLWWLTNTSGYAAEPINRSASIYLHQVSSELRTCAGVGYCLETFRADPVTGTPFGSAVDQYAPYDPTTRPWYMGVETNGTQWEMKPYAWLDMALISVQVLLRDTKKNFVGVATSAINLNQLEKSLAAYADEQAGQYAFCVIAVPGKTMIAATIDGASRNKTAQQQYSAYESPSWLVRRIARGLRDEKWPVGEVMLMGNYVVQLAQLSRISGVACNYDLLVVTVQEAACAHGYYVTFNTKGAPFCKQCSTPYYSYGGSVRNCTVCLPGYYYHEAECTTCPAGTRCTEYGAMLPTLQLRKNYWRSTDTSDKVVSCRDFTTTAAYSCTGGNGTDMHGVFDRDLYCGPHSFGPLCSLCRPEYYYSTLSNKCTHCPTGVWDLSPEAYSFHVLTMLFIGYCINRFVFGDVAICRTLSNQTRKFLPTVDLNEMMFRLKHKLKICWTTVQILASLPKHFNVQFPTAFSVFSALFSFVDLDVTSVWPLDCIVDSRYGSYYRRLLYATLMPVAGVTLLAIVFGLMTLKADNSAVKIDIARNFANVTLIYSFIIFPSVSEVVLSYFSIETLDGVAYISSDLSTVAGTRTYHHYGIYAGLCVIIYPLGVPAAYFFALLRNRHIIDPKFELNNHARVRARRHQSPQLVQRAIAHRGRHPGCRYLDFIYEAYDPRCWWWEVYESLRRISLTSLNSFFEYAGATMQTIICLVIALVNLRIFLYYRPYIEESDDQVAEANLWLIASALFMVLVLGQDDVSQQNGRISIIGVFFVLFNLAVLLYVVFLVERQVEAEIKIAHLKTKFRKMTIDRIMPKRTRRIQDAAGGDVEMQAVPSQDAEVRAVVAVRSGSPVPSVKV